jgi:uncharacterized protein YqjF (DUF2071 family)
MDEQIDIEALDAAPAALLMARLIGRFEARLAEDDGGRWKIVVDSGPEPLRELSAVLDAVQRWVDRDDGNHATIHFRDRLYAIGSRMHVIR